MLAKLQYFLYGDVAETEFDGMKMSVAVIC